SGWHFGAYCSTTKQLEDFDLEKMVKDMEASAPHFWSLLGLFLGEARDEIVGGGPGPDDRNADGDVVMGDESYWDEVDEIDLEGFINGLTSENGLMLSAADKCAKRHATIIMMKKVVIFSIVMQCTNQNANALQSILGIYLQSSHAPQKVIDTLACIGISISSEMINAAVRSLSLESQHSLHDLGQSLLASYAFNTFDVDLKSQAPTAEKTTTLLKHLTFGLMFPLDHSVTSDDIICSE
ncbi:hypothetical protein PAXRUDRAFT_153708, partial [Paxillus rubicundulus Ve08.2h10]